MSKHFQILKVGIEARKLILIITVLIMLIGLVDTASARTRVHVGVGFYSPGYYGDCYPHHGWYGGYHRGYIGHRYYGDDCWDRPWYYPGESVWVSSRSVIVERPVVVERPTVIVRERVIVKNQRDNSGIIYDQNTSKVFSDLRNKKEELLRKVRIGDRQNRMNAVNELAGFSFDDKVRQALEEIVLSDTDPELRKEAIKAFGKVKNRQALHVLEKVRIEDSDRDIRSAADHAINDIKRP